MQVFFPYFLVKEAYAPTRPHHGLATLNYGTALRQYGVGSGGKKDTRGDAFWKGLRCGVEHPADVTLPPVGIEPTTFGL